MDFIAEDSEGNEVQVEVEDISDEEILSLEITLEED